HLNFAAIIAIDRARAVQAGYAVLQRQPGTWTDLSFVSFSDFEDEAGRHQNTTTRQQDDLAVGGKRCAQIQTVSTSTFIGWQVQTVGMGEADEAKNGLLHGT